MSNLPRIEQARQQRSALSQPPKRSTRKAAEASKGGKSRGKRDQLSKVVAQIRIDDWDLSSVSPTEHIPVPPPPDLRESKGDITCQRKNSFRVKNDWNEEQSQDIDESQQLGDHEHVDDPPMKVLDSTTTHMFVPPLEVAAQPLVLDTSECRDYPYDAGNSSDRGTTDVKIHSNDVQKASKSATYLKFVKTPYDEYLRESNDKRKIPNHVNKDRLSASSSPRKIVGLYKLLPGKIKLVSNILENHGMKQTRDDVNFSLLWSTQHLKPHFYQSLRATQKVNLFPLSHECTRKDSLSRNINRMAEVHGKRHFTFMPECYVWPSEKILLEKAVAEDSTRPWIVKPAGSSQGKGIYIASSICELPQRRTDREDNWVVERYIENPLLLDGYKFDLRIYVAVTSFTPLRIFVHEEGLVRLSSEKYSYNKEDYDDKFRHLTNYSVNKTNWEVLNVNQCNVEDAEEDAEAENTNGESDATINDDGNKRASGASQRGLKLTFRQLKERLVDMGYDNDAIWEKIHDSIIKTLISVEPKIKSVSRRFIKSGEDVCFELFGFDVLLDDNLNPFLMEVNFSPSLNTDSQLDFDVKNSVLVDLFNLVKISPHATSKHSAAASIVKSVYQSSDLVTSLHNVSSSRNRHKRNVKQSYQASNTDKLVTSSVGKERLLTMSAEATSPVERKMTQNITVDDNGGTHSDRVERKGIEISNRVSQSSPTSLGSPMSSPTALETNFKQKTSPSDASSSVNTLWSLNKTQKLLFTKLQQEIKRGGSFKCIFPTNTSYKYFNFFEEVSDDLSFLCEYLYKVEGNTGNRWRLLSNKGELIPPSSSRVANSADGGGCEGTGKSRISSRRHSNKASSVASPVDFIF